MNDLTHDEKELVTDILHDRYLELGRHIKDLEVTLKAEKPELIIQDRIHKSIFESEEVRNKIYDILKKCIKSR